MVTTFELLLISKVRSKRYEIIFRGKSALIIGKLGTQNREIEKCKILLSYALKLMRFKLDV